MCWNMIRFDGNKPLYIISPNDKVNNLQNNVRDEDKMYSYVPIGDELHGLLKGLGLEENRGSGQYIIAPEYSYRKAMKDITRRGFAFYFNKLGRDYSRQFKHLRQTYISSEDRFLRRGASMQHSNYKTTLKHYIDHKEVAKEMIQYGSSNF